MGRAVAREGPGSKGVVRDGLGRWGRARGGMRRRGVPRIGWVRVGRQREGVVRSGQVRTGAVGLAEVRLAVDGDGLLRGGWLGAGLVRCGWACRTVHRDGMGRGGRARAGRVWGTTVGDGSQGMRSPEPGPFRRAPGSGLPAAPRLGRVLAGSPEAVAPQDRLLRARSKRCVKQKPVKITGMSLRWRGKIVAKPKRFHNKE